MHETFYAYDINKHKDLLSSSLIEVQLQLEYASNNRNSLNLENCSIYKHKKSFRTADYIFMDAPQAGIYKDVYDLNLEPKTFLSFSPFHYLSLHSLVDSLSNSEVIAGLDQYTHSATKCRVQFPYKYEE